MEQLRMERDSIGEKAIPAGAYYGIQSLRAMENFSISGTSMNCEMIRSLAILKKARSDLVTGPGNGVGDLPVEDAGPCVGDGAGLFEDCKAADHFTIHSGTADGEFLHQRYQNEL